MKLASVRTQGVSLLLSLGLLLAAGAACQSDPSSADRSSPAPDSASADGPAYLGVFYVTNRPSKGARIVDILPASPARQAGIQPGDLVLSVNGREIERGDDLRQAILNMQPGDQATLQIARPGAGIQTIDVRVEAQPPNVQSDSFP